MRVTVMAGRTSTELEPVFATSTFRIFKNNLNPTIGDTIGYNKTEKVRVQTGEISP